MYVNDWPPGPPEDANRVNGLLASTVNAVTLLFIHLDAYAMEYISVLNAIGRVT